MSSPLVHLIQHIPVAPKRSRVLSRLGYRPNVTMLSAADETLLDRAMRDGKTLCRLRGAYGRFNLVHRGERVVELANGPVLESADLARLLEASTQVVLMASTAGEEVVARIADLVHHGSGGFALMLDAVASQAADAGLDWLMAFIDKQLRPEGLRLTRRRYSPGYGDLPVDFQKPIFEALDLARLDMKLTDRCMLVPEKSVLAIAGCEPLR